MRPRLTRYQLLLGGTVLAAAAIAVATGGATRLVLLAALGTVAGLAVGLGVSFPQWQMFGASRCRGRTDRRAVALTFDDGPDPVSTPPLLALLAERRVPATFFCIGRRVGAHPDLVRRMAAAGHEVENHSFRHHRWTNLFPVAKLRVDVVRAQAIIRQFTGHAPRFYRPPMGLTNQRVFRVARELGLEVVGWSARGFDRRRRTPEQIVARLTRRLEPGAILVLHDGGVPPDRLVATVTMLIDKLAVQGYRCVRLDDLISGA